MSTYCRMRSRTVSTDASEKREFRGLKDPNLVSLCHLFPFSLLPYFLSSLATPTETYHWEIVRPAPTDIFIEASILIPIPISTPSRAPKKNLALLSAFEFKVTCSSFSPVSSRFESLFIFVFPLSQFPRTLALSVYRVFHNLVPRVLFLGFGGGTGKPTPCWSIHFDDPKRFGRAE